jgi:hypothetical protein
MPSDEFQNYIFKWNTAFTCPVPSSSSNIIIVSFHSWKSRRCTTLSGSLVSTVWHNPKLFIREDGLQTSMKRSCIALCAKYAVVDSRLLVVFQLGICREKGSSLLKRIRFARA